ncbi:MAG: hypothetical protein DME38_07730 [Verrucomicrobia bacterium]|nr:MAG: hypothetical protein DME38_07730 [Verrucomicrobiota bacterium]
MSPGRIAEQSHSGPAPPDRFSTIRWLGSILVIAAIYFIAGKLGLLLAISPGYATAVSPAAGLALGCIASGTTLQAYAGASLIRWFVGMPTALATEKEVVRFSLISTATCVIAATIGVTALWIVRVIHSADYLTNWVTWYVGDAIGTLIFAPLVLIWTQRAADWRRKLSITLPMTLTLAVVVALFFETDRWEQGRARMEFDQRVESLTQKLQSDFNSYLDVLRSVQNFFASSPSVSQDSFRSFVARDIADHPGIQSLSWDVRVPKAKVPTFIEKARHDGLTNFQLTERDAQLKLIPAALRDEYIVSRYVEPAFGNDMALGFNIASDPIRREAFEWSRDRAEARATKQTKLISEKGTVPAVVVYMPIYTNGLSHDTLEERQHRLEGYVASVLRIGDVIAQSLRGANQEGLQLRLLDDSATSTRQTLFRNSIDRAKPAALQRNTSLEMAGRKWSLECSLSSEYFLAHRSWQSCSVRPGCGTNPGAGCGQRHATSRDC